MQTIKFKAGGTFAYAGVVSGLDPSVAWGAKVDVVNANTDTKIGSSLTASIVQASDFSTTHNWVLSISATAAQTLAWWAATRNTRGLLKFDVKMFNTISTDPVLLSETVQIALEAPVTL